MGRIIFTIPKPPSTNHIYAFTSRGGFARSYITARGQAWFMEAGFIINAQKNGIKTINQPIEVTVNLYTAYFTTQDIDGILKPTLDILQKQGVIKNDNLVLKLHANKYKSNKNQEKVEILILLIP